MLSSYPAESTQDSIDLDQSRESFRSDISAIIHEGPSPIPPSDTYSTPSAYLTPIQTADFSHTVDTLARDVQTILARNAARKDYTKTAEDKEKTYTQTSTSLSHLTTQISQARTKLLALQTSATQTESELKRLGESVRTLDFKLLECEQTKTELRALIKKLEVEEQKGGEKIVGTGKGGTKEGGMSLA
ncbi:hypothetical protein HDV00_007369 [Rhizophlyctis rosea]|nr:hypothetical protein HDV00_007369 [Rhizophlyctis rosea]